MHVEEVDEDEDIEEEVEPEVVVAKPAEPIKEKIVLAKPVAKPAPKPEEKMEEIEIPPLFPPRSSAQKKKDEALDFMNIFGKIAVNIPMLELISKVSSYAKFLKELCTNKRKIAGLEKINLSQNVSAVSQTQLPEKCKDQGTFTIPCKIGHKTIEKALYDLGAGINVMSLREFQELKIGTMKKTQLVIQLADITILHPKGVVEDVLVQVNDFIYPVDFYIIEMDANLPSCTTDILLGRPFSGPLKRRLTATRAVLF